MIMLPSHMEINSERLPLTEYANKYGVSVSTLRRKIKKDQLDCILSDGKYLIADTPYTDQVKPIPVPMPSTQGNRPPQNAPLGSQEPDNNSFKLALSEIKKAYSLVLQEKEESIIDLRREISDLRTLVKVLEHEVARIQEKEGLKPSSPLNDLVF